MTEYLPKPDYSLLDVGVQIRIGPWLLNEWQENNILNRFIGCIGFYKDCFVTELKQLNLNNKFKAQIITYPNTYCDSKSKLDWDSRVLLKEKVDELLSSGVLRESESPFSSPVHPKKFKELNVRKLFICLDYFDLNEITIDFNYSVPTPKTVVESICESSLFSRIVIKDALHQIGLEEESIPKTAFDTKFGKFEFTVLHDGMKNADAYLQMLMDNVLEGVDKNYVKVYLDQILVHSNGFDAHLIALNKVLSRIKSSNLKIDLEESKFLMKSINYIGFEINEIGISIPAEITREIFLFKFPNSVEDVKLFLKSIINYRSFIQQFDQLTAPINHILNTDCFILSEQLRKAIFLLKEAFWTHHKSPLYIPLKPKDRM